LGVGGARGNMWEINRLKRENKSLKELIGQLLFEREKGKKIEIMPTLTIKVNKTKLEAGNLNRATRQSVTNLTGS
jgi:hypothetical protein